jgi:hypothetical protein
MRRSELDTRIGITPLTDTIGKGESIDVTFKLTEPILCPGNETDRCTLTVIVTNTRPDELKLSACHCRWMAADWEETCIITVSARENFVDDGEKEIVLQTEAAVSKAEFYSGINPPDIVIKTKSRGTAQCTSTTDPNIKTFDGARFLWLGSGTYSLWKAEHRHFEVQARSTSGLNCGVVIRDHCDYVTIDRCSGSLAVSAQIQDNVNGPKVVRKNGGTTYTVSFPRASGAIVEVVARHRINRHGSRACGWSGCRTVYSYSRTDWLDIYATAPGLDYGMVDATVNSNTPRTSGACGSFDFNRGNDNTNINAHIIPNSQSLFSRKPTCTPRPAGPPLDFSECVVPPLPSEPTVILDNPDAEDVTDLLKDSLFPDDDPRINYDFDLEGPDATLDPPELNATQLAFIDNLCEVAVTQSQAASVCQAVGVNLTQFVETCIQDMRATLNQDLIDGALDALHAECTFRLQSNATFFDRAPNGTLLVSDRQRDVLGKACPNDCSFQGTCNEGRCTCDEGYTGFDCQGDLNAVAVLDNIFPFRCDIRQKDKCPATLAAVGEDFLNHPNLTCLVADALTGEHLYATNGTFVSATEVRCQAPDASSHSGAAPRKLAVSVSTNGTYFSATRPYSLYDSLCMDCDRDAVCNVRADACNIGNTCFAQGAQHSDNPCLACVPTVSNTAFSFQYADAARCGPAFDEPAYSTVISEAATVGTKIDITLDAQNFKVAGDPNMDLVYSFAPGTPADITSTFTLAARADNRQQAELTLAQPLNYESRSEYAFEVVATDHKTNTARISVTLSVIDINEKPVFTQASYEAEIDENAPATSPLIEATATDEDSGTDNPSFAEVTFSLVNVLPLSVRSLVAIDPATGVISTSGPLDFEAIPSPGHITFTIEARDGGGSAATVPGKIVVRDLNEKPTFIAISKNTLPENSPVDTVVGIITVIDEDEDQTHTFSLEDPSGLFKVVAAAGPGRRRDSTGHALAVATTDPSQLNFEGQKSYLLKITATDSGTPPLSFTSDIEVRLTDENDVPTNVRVYSLPVPDELNLTMAVPLTALAEDTIVNSQVGLVATDDEDAGQTHTFTIVSQSPAGFFAVADRFLVLKTPLDYETEKNHQVVLQATDDGFPAKTSAPFTLTLTITDVAEKPGNLRFADLPTLDEGSSIGDKVADITASDPEGEEFTFQVADGETRFRVGPTTCEATGPGDTVTCTAEVFLNTDTPVDFESNDGKVQLQLQLVDKVTGDKTPVSIDVPVIDRNDPPTSATLVSGAGGVLETAKNGDVVGKIAPIDEDTTDGHVVTLLNDAGGAFLLDPACADPAQACYLLVNDASKLSPPPSSPFVIRVSITDKAGASVEVDMQVPVVDVDTDIQLNVGDLQVPEFVDTSSSPTHQVITQFELTGFQPTSGQPLPEIKVGGAGEGILGVEKVTDTPPTFKLVVLDPTKLDAETSSTLDFTLELSGASPSDPPALSKSFTLNITPQDEPPVMTVLQAPPATLHHDSAPATPVMRVGATDPEGAAVSFSLSGTSSNRFSIGPDGAVRLAVKPSAVGMGAGKLLLNVQATDAGGKTRTMPVELYMADDCTPNPFCGFGNCTDSGEFKYTCNCLDGYTGDTCEQALASTGDSSSSSGAGMIIGVAVAIVALVALVLLFIVYRRRQQAVDLTPNPAFVSDKERHDSYGVGLAGNNSAAYAQAPTMGASALSNPMYAASASTWLQPEMTRDEAYEYLRGQEVGAFVIREMQSTPGWHALSLKVAPETIQDEKIKCTAEGEYQLVSGSVPAHRRPSFADLSQLVSHYATRPSSELPVQLKVPGVDSDAIYGDLRRRGQGEDMYESADRFARDAAAPVVPLKNRERSAAQAIAAGMGGEGEELYTNRDEALAALAVDSTGADDDNAPAGLGYLQIQKSTSS